MSYSFLFLLVPEELEYYRASAQAETVLRELDRDQHFERRWCRGRGIHGSIVVRNQFDVGLTL